jgi:hypothetical protein
MPTMYDVKKGYHHDNKVENKPISVEINDLQTIDMYTGMYSPGIWSNTVKKKPSNDPLSSGKFDDIPLLRTNSKEENVDIEKGKFQIIDPEDDVHNNDNDSNDNNNNKYNDNEYDINNIDCSIDKNDDMSFDDTNNMNNIINSNSNSEKNVVKIVKLQTSVNYSTNTNNGDYGNKNKQPITNLEEIRL